MNLTKISKKIKLVLTDVDGVLTDGGFYYSSNGEILKKFFVRDGMGVTLLRKKEIPTIIVTKEKSPIVKTWCQKMKIQKIYDGVIKKEIILEKVSSIYKVKPSEVAYIGDDINDVELLKKVGLSAAPLDASIEAKKVSYYICKKKRW